MLPKNLPEEARSGQKHGGWCRVVGRSDDVMAKLSSWGEKSSQMGSCVNVCNFKKI